MLPLIRGKNTTRYQFYFSLEQSYNPCSLGKIYESMELTTTNLQLLTTNNLQLFDNSYAAYY